MTAFQNKRFSVSQSGRSPEDCGHGWIVKGRCWYCGSGASDMATLDLASESAIVASFPPSPPEPSE